MAAGAGLVVMAADEVCGGVEGVAGESLVSKGTEEAVACQVVAEVAFVDIG